MFSPDVPALIVGDPLRIGQILSNLVSNAVKFTAHGSTRVRIDSQCSDAGEFYLRIAVQGQPAPGSQPTSCLSSLTSLLKPLESIGREYGGTGLGLAITPQAG